MAKSKNMPRGEATYQKHLRRYHRSMTLAVMSLGAMHRMIQSRCGEDRARVWEQGPLAEGDCDPMPVVMPSSLAAAVEEVERYWRKDSEDESHL